LRPIVNVHCKKNLGDYELNYFKTRKSVLYDDIEAARVASLTWPDD